MYFRAPHPKRKKSKPLYDHIILHLSKLFFSKLREGRAEINIKIQEESVVPGPSERSIMILSQEFRTFARRFCCILYKNHRVIPIEF